MNQNLLIVHGGGPTAVINASLCGAVKQAQRTDKLQSIFGARFGCEGFLKEDFVDLTHLSDSQLDLLTKTPASAIGTSRWPLTPDDFPLMVNILKKHQFGYVLFNGGNGTMDTCGRLYKACLPEHIRVAGIPKTTDNDICGIDHSPGFASAAKYLAESLMELAQDLKSMPNQVCVVETMGRNTGWLAAASSLARTKYSSAPHLIYFPEKAFDEKKFLLDVKMAHHKYGGIIIVVSEGLKKADGSPLLPPVFKSSRAITFGSVAEYLAHLIIKKLKIKARYEKPGIFGRCSIHFQSKNDCREAILLGKFSVDYITEGYNGFMTCIDNYSKNVSRIPIAQAMLTEKRLPQEFISDSENDVTPAFGKWITSFSDITPVEFFDIEQYTKSALSLSPH